MSLPKYSVTQKDIDDIETITIGGWKISTRDTKILSSHKIDDISEKYSLRAIPEMIFGNYVLFEYAGDNSSTKLTIKLDPVDALKSSDPLGAKDIKVKHSKKWKKNFESKEKGEDPDVKIQHLQDYDWTFTPRYSGDVTNETQEEVKLEPTTEKFNIKLLTREDPVLFYKQMTFFEDDLGDNGISQLSLKLRVMPTCFFILFRFWLRIDGVLFRIYETRYFHEFGKDYVLREVQAKEGDWNPVFSQLGGDHLKYTDVEQVVKVLKLKGQQMEKIPLKKE